MRLPRCRACGLPVLGLDGQIGNLDSYYLSQEGPPPESAGWWHARCLAESPVGPAWYEARLRNHRDVRRFEPLADLEHWTVLRHPRTNEVLAFGRSGEFLSLSLGRGRSRQVDGGSVYAVVEDDYNLELDDEPIVKGIQDALATDGKYALPTLIEQIGIRDRMLHPEALERGALRFKKALRRHWGPRWVSGRMEYGVFVPAELEPYVGEYVR